MPVACCTLSVARCLLHVVCCMLHVACCTLHVACLSGEPMARRLLVEARLRSRTDQGAHSPASVHNTAALRQTPQCWRNVQHLPHPRRVFGFPLKPQTRGFGPRALIHPCRATPCCAVLCFALLCCALLCCATPCRAAPCRAVPCCAVLCYAVLFGGQSRPFAQGCDPRTPPLPARHTLVGPRSV